MRLGESVKSITYLKNNTAEVVRDVARDGRPLVVTQNGEARAVVLDVATYDRWREAIAMLKLLALGEIESSTGAVVPADRAFDRAFEAIEVE
jgi:prevent-host-death family protein